jgi:hypothetical protein
VPVVARALGDAFPLRTGVCERSARSRIVPASQAILSTAERAYSTIVRTIFEHSKKRCMQFRRPRGPCSAPRFEHSAMCATLLPPLPA